MRRLSLIALLFAFAGPTIAAHGETYDFSFSGGGLNASGVLTTTGDIVTSFTGTQNGDAISLLAPGVFGGNDNIFSPVSPYFDFSGLSYAVDGTGFNLYYTGVGSTIRDCSSCEGNSTDGPIVDFSISAPAATPEPSSLVLLGTGVLGLAGAVRRRFGK